MNKSKVLFILKVPPPIHGSSVMNQHVLNSDLIKNNFNSIFLKLSLSRNIREIGKFSLRKIWITINDIFKLIKLIKKFNPELVYFSLSPIGLALIKDFILVKIIKKFSCPIIFHLHSKGIQKHGEKSRLYHILYSNLFKDCNTICLAKELINDISTYVSKKPYIVPNGIDDMKFRINDKSKLNTPRIVFLSNFRKSKGILEIIKAASILRDKGILFKLVLIGDSGDISINKLKSKVYRHNLTNYIDHIGPLYGIDKFKKLSESDLLVFPTTNEAFGLVILEAMQCGLPVISFNEGGIPSVIDNNKTGFIVDRENINILIEKIRWLIENPDERIKMGIAGRKKFEEEYTIMKFELNLINTINSALIDNYSLRSSG
jgi:glycosyltransferase involved in cell wall biosynthesis